MSSSRQNQPTKSHSPASIITGVLYDDGTSVRRATGTTSKAPSVSSQTYEETYTSPSFISSPPSNLIRKRKVIHHGVIQSFEKIEVIIYAETHPWWILALDPSRISTLCFPMFSCLSALNAALRSNDTDSPLATILEDFDSHLFSFNVSEIQMESALLLVTGSVHFFLDVWDIPMNPRSWIFCTDKHQRMRKLPDFPVQLHRVCHFQQGGPTSYEMLWASSDDIILGRHKLVRTIGDFMDHSIRPQVCPGPPEKHFSPSSILPVKALNSEICYPTHFTSSGFGLRPLVASELSHAFGIPSRHVDKFEIHHFPIPPVQVLDSLFLEWSTMFLGSSRKLRKTEFCVPTPKPISDVSKIFFPKIRRSLPPDWSFSAPAAEKAAKSDDAIVNELLWNNRVRMIWPRAQKLIPALRSLILRRQRRLIYHEFRFYLRKRYSDLYFEYIYIKKNIYTLMFGNRLMGGCALNKMHGVYSGSDIKKYKQSLRAAKFYQLYKDIEIGIMGLRSISESSFFNWDNGSTLLFWRWHPNLQRIARDGFPAQITNSLPHSFKKSRPPKSNVYEKILSKLKKGLSRGYLIPEKFSKIKNLIDFFAVPKAEDIRMVQNGSSCGLNNSIWASNFWLPNASSMTRILGFNYKAVDLDLGEMFLNFPLERKLISYSGMDLTPYKKDLKNFFHRSNNDEEKSKIYVVNSRNWMGLRPSPEWSCRFYYLAEEFIRGNEKEKSNPLRWDRVILNLIGNPDFNPSLPNVFKWNDDVQRLAGEIKAYVDDLRALGWSLEHAWAIAHLIASRLQFLGIQDAPRKRRIDQGPWAGSIYISNENEISKTVSKEKWMKAKNYISEIKERLNLDKDYEFDFKYLEQIRGFLCHLALTFDVIFPFLKGFHLLLCHHLPQRNEEGWKINEMEWLAYLQEAQAKGSMSSEEVQQMLDFKYDPKVRPAKVKPIPRFVKSIEALDSLFSEDEPPIVTVRASSIQFIIYGFADASKSGFGASLEYADSVRYRVGTWSQDEDSNSSNFREFSNIVETIEEEVEAGRLKNTTLVLATDNSTVESALYKGNSSSELLFDLIIRFKASELKSGSHFIVTHVSGERMKFQGTDGISRGQLREGIALGESMLTYCPWGLSAGDRFPPILDWCKEVFGSDLELLSPSEWFTRGHDHDGGFYDVRNMFRLNIRHGTYLWQPPPAAADAALEELRKARLKRRKSTHIVIIPRLFTTLWLKQLYKAADIVLYLPCNNSNWPSSMHEPLVIGILFPYSRFFPWQFKGTPRLLAHRREVQSLLQKGQMDPGDLLRKLFCSTRKISSLPEHLVRRLLYFSERNDVPYTSAGGARSKRRKVHQ